MTTTTEVCLRAVLLSTMTFAGTGGCTSGEPDEPVLEIAQALGDSLGGIAPDDFAAARDAFNTVEELGDGLGPIFNERACGNCHTLGAQGGAGEQIERRFGRFLNSGFDPMESSGGSLRQLFTVGTFTRSDGQICTVPQEVEPAEATVHDVGRLTTPLFGLGLVDAMPDSFFDGLAAAEPPEQRGIVNRVSILLPNPDDPSQSPGGTRVGRFGWKAGISNLTQFAADAYINEMGITTQSCIGGVSILAFATESAPSGVPQPDGCDDLALPAPDGIPAGTDDAVGSCDGGLTEIQDDVDEFATFMTFLAPPTRGPITPDVEAGEPIFVAVGCQVCHTPTTFVTPASTGNGVPGNTAFNPFSDFLVHDMGALGDQIGNPGDSVAATQRMRTAPLWGIRVRNKLLHDGRTNDIGAAILAHDGQGAAARDAFSQLGAADQHSLIEYVRSL